MNGAQLRAPGLWRSPIHSIHGTRRVEAPLIPATAKHPYVNHSTLAAHTVVRRNGNVGASTGGVSRADASTVRRNLDQETSGAPWRAPNKLQRYDLQHSRDPVDQCAVSGDRDAMAPTQRGRQLDQAHPWRARKELVTRNPGTADDGAQSARLARNHLQHNNNNGGNP